MYDNNEGLHRNIIHGILFWNEWTLWIYFRLFLKSLFDYWWVFSDFFFLPRFIQQRIISRVVWFSSHMSHLEKICYEHIMKCNQLKIHIRKFAQNSCKMNGLQGIQLYRVFRYNATSLGVMLDTVICSRK